MRRIMWLAMGLMSVSGAVCASAQDLKAVEDIYKKNSDAISSAFQLKFESLQQKYVKTLETVKTSAVKRGDLERVKAAVIELERFAKMKSLPTVMDERVPPEFRPIQSAYVDQYARLETDMTMQLGALTLNYIKALDHVQKELTMAEKLDEATAVLEEKTRAQETVKGYTTTLVALKGLQATNGVETAVSHDGLASRATPSWMADNKKFGVDKDPYLVIDLSGGKDAKKYPVSYLAEVPGGGWNNMHKEEKLVMRRVEPGTFSMGSPEKEPGRQGGETQHKVTLTQAFYIGVFEVTQRQWELVTGEAPSCSKGHIQPVESVSYNDILGCSAGSGWPADNKVDAASFMGLLRAKTGLATLGLPTEAQWEYACRAGTDTPYAQDLDKTAWCQVNSEKTPHPVGQKRPNAWGLYDMHGNVWEWCLDWRGEYSAGRSTDPAGAANGAGRVFRGGSWDSQAGNCRSACRCYVYPYYRSGDFGFRLARTLQ